MKGKKSYGDKVNVNYNIDLGCGACIRSNYTFCIPSSSEVSEPSSWKSGTKAQCCKDDACVNNVLKDTSVRWTCSKRDYADSNLAMAMCPFDKKKCGNVSAINFTGDAPG